MRVHHDKNAGSWPRQSYVVATIAKLDSRSRHEADESIDVGSHAFTVDEPDELVLQTHPEQRYESAKQAPLGFALTHENEARVWREPERRQERV